MTGFVEGAYTRLAEGDAGASIGAVACARAEAAVSRAVADRLAAQLPADANAREKLLAEGYAVARAMSWERVAEDMLIPVLRRLEK